MCTYIYGEKINGKFIKRLNRFEGLVEVNGNIELVHIPNTGRMIELLHNGTEVILIKNSSSTRKTKFTLYFIYKENHLVCINSAFANRVFEDALKNNEIDWISGEVKREVTYKNSRFDFLVSGDSKTLVEVKCATFEKEGVVMFPDAPTERGRRHIAELIESKDEGYNAAIVILAFMDYVTEFIPYYAIDNDFGIELQRAVNCGVVFKVYRCEINKDFIEIKDEIKTHF